MSNKIILSEFKEWANEDTDFEVVEARLEGAEKLLEILEAWMLNHPRATKEQILDFLDTQVAED